MLLCIEGVDGSGKGTITKLLLEHFQSVGKKTQMFSFPAYGSGGWSDVIGKYLNGDYGLFPVEVQAGLFALERLSFKSKIKEALSTNDIVFCDRYVPSNLAYAAAMVGKSREEEVTNLIWQLEYMQMGLPKPDCIVFLDMPVDYAIRNIAKKHERQYTKKTLDLLERKRELLHNVASVYSQMGVLHPNAKFLRVNCLDEKAEGNLLSFSEIVLKIVSFISSFME